MSPSRGIALLAAAAALAATAVGAAQPAGRSGRAPVSLPLNPWATVERCALPSPCATPAVTLPDGSIAVGLEAPPGVAFITGAGERIAVAPLPRRITQPLAVGRDGRVWVVADRFVFTVAPDGTLRSSAELLGRVEGPAMVRPDGTAVVVGGALNAAAEFTIFSASGDPVGVRAAGPVLRAERAARDDGRIVTFDARSLVALDARDRVTRSATLPELRRIAPLEAGLAMATARTLFLADAQGLVRHRVELPAAPAWLAPFGEGRVGVALAGASPQLWIVDARGVGDAPRPLPAGAEGPWVDPAGAVLLPSRSGVLLCLAPDGAERWRLTTNESLRPPAAPLIHGGVALATESSTLLFLRDGP